MNAKRALLLLKGRVVRQEVMHCFQTLQVRLGLASDINIIDVIVWIPSDQLAEPVKSGAMGSPSLARMGRFIRSLMTL